MYAGFSATQYFSCSLNCHYYDYTLFASSLFSIRPVIVLCTRSHVVAAHLEWGRKTMDAWLFSNSTKNKQPKQKGIFYRDSWQLLKKKYLWPSLSQISYFAFVLHVSDQNCQIQHFVTFSHWLRFFPPQAKRSPGKQGRIHAHDAPSMRSF